ncbi:MAG: TonB-dependent receptor, partial [Bacteroidales bacterium]|nr:TonB-dependent receptor [Bacteroidales bacterium]
MKQKKIKFWKLLLLVLLIIPQQLSAQILNITGTITDEASGAALPGVTVIVKGTTIGAISDFDGKYAISAQKGSTLSFSYIGYSEVDLLIADQTQIDVTMSEEFQSLDEVVVIGYGVQKKSDKTGAVASINADELNGGVLTDPIQAMQGKIAGVSISKKGGDPNAGFSVKIRGSSGFDSNTNPLYVVDGVPGVDPTTVAPEDIASFNVLKDASSTAIYGARGANGVIIIQTKNGSQGQKANIDFNSYVSIDQVANRLDMLNGDEIRQYVADNGLNFTDGGANTDWQDQIYRTGISQSYNLAASGGSESGTYRVSLSHSDWDGVVKGTSKQRTIGRINMTQKAINDRLTLSASLSGTIEANDYISYGASGSNDVFYQAFQRNPTDPVYNADGSYFESQRDFNYYNPVALIEQIQNTRDAKRFLGNLKADFKIAEGLVAGVNLGYIRDDSESYYFEPSSVRGGTSAGYGRRSYGNNESKILETTLSYNKNFSGGHNLSAVAGYSFQEDARDGLGAQGREPLSDFVQAYNIKTFNDVNVGDIWSYYETNRLISFFGRAVYNYNNKYYATATLRRDGSSRFGANQKWGWFPSGSLAWNLKEEDFLSDVSELSMLKLRAGFGLSGNQEIGNYHSIGVVNIDGTTINFETGEDAVKFSKPYNDNPDLKWEENAEINVGIDFGLLKNKITGSLEYYYKSTYDLLAQYAVPVPPNISQNTWANAGNILNQGVELNVNYFAINNENFSWKTSVTFAKNNQKVLSLSGPGYDWTEADKKTGWLSGRGLVGSENWTQLIEEDYELGTFFMPEYAGLSADGKFLFWTAAGGVTRNVEDAERRVVGSALPDFEMGWSNYFTFFKNFDANISIRGVYGNDVLNVTRMVFENSTILPPLNTLSSVTDEIDRGLTDAPKVNSYYLEDGSFLRIDNVAVGYNLAINDNDWIQKLRVYISSNNLYTLTGYSGIDPETSYDGKSFGLDMYNVYPKTRTLTFGV